MKKFLSLTVALAMTVAMVPATAFAKSDMKVTRQITAESNDLIYTGAPLDGQTKVTRDAPYLVLTADGGFKSGTQTFRLKLTNAEWLNETADNGKTKVKFETNGAKATTVKDASGKSMIDNDATDVGDKDKVIAAAKKELQDALDADKKGTDSSTGVSFKVSDYENALAAAIKAEKVKKDGTTLDTDTTTELLKGLSENVGHVAKGTQPVPAPATPLPDGSAKWNAAVLASNNYLKAVTDEEAKQKIVKDSKTLSDGVDTFNGLLQLAGDHTDIDVLYVTNEYDAAIAADKTTEQAVQAVLDSIVTEADKIAFGKAITGHYAELAASATATKAREARKDVENQRIAAFAEVCTGSGEVKPGVALKAEEVLTAYEDGGKNTAALRRYLDTKVKPAGMDNIVDLTVKYSEAKAGTGVTPPPVAGLGKVTIERVTDSLAMVTVETSVALPDDAEISIPLYTKITGGETATVEVDPRDSEFSSDSKTFAKVSEGSTTSFVDTTKNFYDGDTLNTIYIDENAAGTFEPNKVVTLKLSSGFEWGDTQANLRAKVGNKIKMLNGGELLIDTESIIVDGNEITFKLTGKTSVNPATISLSDMIIKEDGADFGTTAKVTVSGAGITKKVVELGTYADFGLTLTAESKALPLIYAGSYDEDNESLKVTFEETVQSSWITERKTEFALPEDVKIVDIEVKKAENIGMSAADLEDHLKDNIDGNETSITARKADVPDGKKGKFEAIFTVTADPTFTGDVELTAGGPAIGSEKLSKAIATVASPLTVKSSVNEVKIDYRNVDVNSITITEAEAGLWEKGDTITLEVEEMQFESGIKAEVVTGDMKLEKLDGDNVKVNKKAGTVTIQVKSTSSSTPAEIKIDGIKLYLDRSLPVGDYELSIVTTADNNFKPEFNHKEKDLLFANYCSVTKDFGDKVGKIAFDTDSVVVLKDFVKVVTAARDQGDGFTTQIVVPVGSDKIIAGTNEIAIDAPAYINADGYTMLPVRAVIEALNGIAVVRWDDASKTCTISYANKVFAMTVGSKTMNMNGVSTALLAAPEIKSERIFLPLRDLGYALGLSDNKIVWDASTNTATLNPMAGNDAQTTAAPAAPAAPVAPVAPAAPAAPATPATPAV